MHDPKRLFLPLALFSSVLCAQAPIYIPIGVPYTGASAPTYPELAQPIHTLSVCDSYYWRNASTIDQGGTVLIQTDTPEMSFQTDALLALGLAPTALQFPNITLFVHPTDAVLVAPTFLISIPATSMGPAHYRHRYDLVIPLNPAFTGMWIHYQWFRLWDRNGTSPIDVFATPYGMMVQIGP